MRTSAGVLSGWMVDVNWVEANLDVNSTFYGAALVVGGTGAISSFVTAR